MRIRDELVVRYLQRVARERAEAEVDAETAEIGLRAKRRRASPHDSKDSVSIYALVDPRSGKPRYVGKTWAIGKRLARHLGPSEAEKMPLCAAWFDELRSLGMEAGIVLLERCDAEVWRAREFHHIRAMRTAGFDLLNILPRH